MRVVTILTALCWLVAAIPSAATADLAAVRATLTTEGYVSIPFKRGEDRRFYVEAVIHGSKLRLMLDLTSDNSIFDIGTLRNLDIAFERTEIIIPTRSKNVRIHTGRILGIEFDGKSTGPIEINAGDVDPVYSVKPGVDGPDGVLGAEFLGRYDALLDVKNQILLLKVR
ncbi:MAG: hypothetical protein QMC73_04015 [Myxococcota bacterium]